MQVFGDGLIRMKTLEEETALARTPEWTAEITGVSTEDIRKLAREMATEQLVGIRIVVALERHYGGGHTIRTVACSTRNHSPIKSGPCFSLVEGPLMAGCTEKLRMQAERCSLPTRWEKDILRKHARPHAR